MFYVEGFMGLDLKGVHFDVKGIGYADHFVLVADFGHFVEFFTILITEVVFDLDIVNKVK